MNRIALLVALFAYTASAQGIYPKNPENWNVVCDNTHANVHMPEEATLISTAATARQRDPATNAVIPGQEAKLTIVYQVGDRPAICNIDSTAQDDLFDWNLAVRFGLPDAGSEGEANQVANPDYRHFGTNLVTADDDDECSTSGELDGAGALTSRLNVPSNLAISASTSAGAGAQGSGQVTIIVNLDEMADKCTENRWGIDGTAGTAPRIYQAPNGQNPFGPNQYGCESFYVPVSVLWEEDHDRNDAQDHPKLVVSVIIVEVSFCPVYDRTICITWVPEMELVYPVFAEVDSVMPIHDGAKTFHVDYDFEVRVENPGPDGDCVRARDMYLVQHCLSYGAADRITNDRTATGWLVPGLGSTATRMVTTTLDHHSSQWLGALAPNTPGDSESWAQNTRFGWATETRDFDVEAANYFANCQHGDDMFEGEVNHPTADLCFSFGLESCTDETGASCFPIDLPHPMRFCYKLPVTIFYADEAENITFNLAANEPTLLVWEEQGHLLNSYGEAAGNTYLDPAQPNHVVANWRGAAGAGIGASNGVYNPLWLDASVPSELDKRGILQRRNQLSLATYFAPFVQPAHAGLHAGVHAGFSHADWTSVDVDAWIQPSSLILHSLCDGDPANNGFQVINTNEHIAISEVEQDRQFAVFSSRTSRDWSIAPETDVSSEPAAWYSHYPKRYCSQPDATLGRRTSGSYAADQPACWGTSGKQVKLPMVTTYEQGGYGFGGVRHDNVDGFSLNTYWTLHSLFTASAPGVLGSRNAACPVEQIKSLSVTGHVQVVHWGNYNNNNNYPPRRALLGIQKSDFSMSNTVNKLADSLSEKQRRLLQQGNQQVTAGEKGTAQETVVLLGQEEAAQPPAMIGPIVPIAAGGAVSLCCCFFLMAARRRSKKNKVKAFNKYKGEAFSAKVVDTAVVQIQAQNDVASVA